MRARRQYPQGSEASFTGYHGTDGMQLNDAQLAHFPPVFRDMGHSRVSRVQDILLFLQSPQMDVAEYRVRCALMPCARIP